ncbi:MAG: ATP synthase archaeal subunit H [ANME-2 cluster archaeon]|nr:ATP synthase archaeal subunit H [ANME-2 cluster archaeon]
MNKILHNGENNMTKADILSQIKKAEEDTRTMISEANEAKAKKILEAKNRSRELINEVKNESAAIADTKISHAKEKIKSEKEKMLKEGVVVAESIKSKANSNVAKATEYLVEQFERSIHA